MKKAAYRSYNQPSKQQMPVSDYMTARNEAEKLTQLKPPQPHLAANCCIVQVRSDVIMGRSRTTWVGWTLVKVYKNVKVNVLAIPVNVLAMELFWCFFSRWLKSCYIIWNDRSYIQADTVNRWVAALQELVIRSTDCTVEVSRHVFSTHPPQCEISCHHTLNCQNWNTV